MNPVRILLAVLLLGMITACAMPEIPYASLRERHGLPSSRQFEPEPGLVVHYTDEGNPKGPAIVFVHGFAASVHAWRPWIERLKAHYRLIAIDLPGHGLTQAPRGYRASIDANAALVDKLADQAGVQRFVLAGNSMGGAVALSYALAHPDRLDGLVLVDSAGGAVEDVKSGGGPPIFVGLLQNPLGRTVIKSFDPKSFARGGLKSAYHDESLVTPELIARYRDLALAPGHRDVLLMQRSRPSRLIRRADLAGMETPTLVMSGEQDKLIPVENARRLAAAIPGAELVTYPEGGHVPMEQLPDQSAEDLRRFLKRIWNKSSS